MAISNALGPTLLSPLFFFIAGMNFLLAIFNLFPGYPLDGGRVLRAFFWKRGKDLNEATVLTGRFGTDHCARSDCFRNFHGHFCRQCFYGIVDDSGRIFSL